MGKERSHGHPFYDRRAMTPALIAAVHGTRSAAGAATSAALISRIRSLRPSLEVVVAYLDVQQPRLSSVLSERSGPAVVVPVLLSGGYHVVDDIPATAASASAGAVRVARHLGPDRALVRVLVERLSPYVVDTIALVGSPSTHVSARRDLADAATLLAAAVDRPVHPLTVDASLASSLGALPGRVAVATYLLGEGFFYETLRTVAARAGAVAVTEPLGAHPAIAALILQRYDEARGPA